MPFHVSTVIISPIVKTVKNMSLKIYSKVALVAYWLCSCLVRGPWVQAKGLRGREAALERHGVPMCHPDQPKVSKHILISSSAKLPGKMVLKGLKREKIFLSIQKGTEHYHSWKEDPRGSSTDTRCWMMWRMQNIADSPKKGVLIGIFGPESSVYHNRTAKIIFTIYQLSPKVSISLLKRLLTHSAHR